MKNKARGIIAIHKETGERREFDSINGAAKGLGVTFDNISSTADRGGSIKGWKVYHHPESIERQIAKLQESLEIVKNL